MTVNSGTSGNSTIAVTNVNGFAGSVDLVATSSTDLYCTLIPTRIMGGPGNSTLSCSGLTAGNYTVTVTGTSGTLSHAVVIGVIIQSGSVGGVVLPVDRLGLLLGILPVWGSILTSALVALIVVRTGSKRKERFDPRDNAT